MSPIVVVVVVVIVVVLNEDLLQNDYDYDYDYECDPPLCHSEWNHAMTTTTTIPSVPPRLESGRDPCSGERERRS